VRSRTGGAHARRQSRPCQRTRTVRGESEREVLYGSRTLVAGAARTNVREGSGAGVKRVRAVDRAQTVARSASAGGWIGCTVI